MLFPHAAEVALTALALFDPRGPAGPPQHVGDLAKRTSLPAPYLAKVLQQLVVAGLLRSRRGRRGGFVLGRPAGEITLADVVLAFSGQDELAKAIPPANGSVGRLLAPLHAELLRILGTTTLEALSRTRAD